MKIIDIIVRSFYDIARRGEGIRRLDTAIIVTNFFFMFNEMTLFNYLIGSYFSFIVIHYVIYALIGGIMGYFTLRTLEREYLNKQGYTRILNTHIPKVLGIVILIVYYFATIFLFFYSLSFLPYKPLNV